MTFEGILAVICLAGEVVTSETANDRTHCDIPDGP